MTTATLTFDDICAMEPRLRDLERAVRELVEGISDDSPRCANAAWYGYDKFIGKGIKPRLLELVGFERKPPGYIEPTLPPLPRFFSMSDPVVAARARLLANAKADALSALDESGRRTEAALATPQAFDVVYEHLYEFLPSCSGCMCL